MGTPSRSCTVQVVSSISLDGPPEKHPAMKVSAVSVLAVCVMVICVAEAKKKKDEAFWQKKIDTSQKRLEGLAQKLTDWADQFPDNTTSQIPVGEITEDDKQTLASEKKKEFYVLRQLVKQTKLALKKCKKELKKAEDAGNVRGECHASGYNKKEGDVAKT